MKCQQTFCPHPATSNIFMQFRVHANHEPAISNCILSLCDACATQVTWADLMPDEQFEQICLQFESMGRMRPVKQFCNILIEPIINELPDNNSSISQ